MEELTKQVVAIGAAVVTAFVGALCGAYVPLLQRVRRRQQEVELGLKEIERIEKALAAAARLKSDHGVELDAASLAPVARRMELVLRDMRTDEEVTRLAIEEYLGKAVGLRGLVTAPLPRIRIPRRLALQIGIQRLISPWAACSFVVLLGITWLGDQQYGAPVGPVLATTSILMLMLAASLLAGRWGIRKRLQRELERLQYAASSAQR